MNAIILAKVQENVEACERGFGRKLTDSEFEQIRRMVESIWTEMLNRQRKERFRRKAKQL